MGALGCMMSQLHPKAYCSSHTVVSGSAILVSASEMPVLGVSAIVNGDAHEACVVYVSVHHATCMRSLYVVYSRMQSGLYATTQHPVEDRRSEKSS